MTGYLFIGGSHNGRRIAVEKESVDLPVTQFGHPVHGEVAKDSIGIEWEHYRSFRITGEAQEFIVYVVADLGPDDVFRMLISNYEKSFL